MASNCGYQTEERCRLMIPDVLVALSGDEWTRLGVATIAAIASCFTAGITAWVLYLLHTPSRTRIGKQVEDNRHVNLSNNYRLQRIERYLDLAEPANEDELNERLDEGDAG